MILSFGDTLYGSKVVIIVQGGLVLVLEKRMEDVRELTDGSERSFESQRGKEGDYGRLGTKDMKQWENKVRKRKRPSKKLAQHRATISGPKAMAMGLETEGSTPRN